MENNKIRILFVGFNRQYVNRTFSVLIRAILANQYLDFYGPGFRTTQELEAGPERWLDLHGPYDLVLFESYVFEHDVVSKRVTPFAADYIRFRKDDFFTYGPQLQSFIKQYNGMKLFVSNFDIYGISQQHIEELENLDCFILCAPSRMSVMELQERFHLSYEDSTGKGFWAGKGNDNWVNFISQNKEKVLEIPAGVGLEQFSYTPLQLRTQRFTVPGTSYAERKMVYHFMTKQQRLKRFSDKIKDKLYSMYNDRLTIRKLTEINLRYDMDIANSCIAYTSGSIFRRSVRKYFEIPALGSMPIGQVCDAFEELGFKDGINFRIAETPNDVKEILDNYDEADVQVIASNARKLIFEKHSEQARAKQLDKSLRLIVKGSFKGSYWDNGEYSHY